MKLLRYGPAGQEAPGLLGADGVIRDLSGIVDDISRGTLLPDSLERLRGIDPDTLPKVDGAPRIGPCVGSVGKFICIGLKPPPRSAARTTMSCCREDRRRATGRWSLGL
jgi:hypothetical protein